MPALQHFGRWLSLSPSCTMDWFSKFSPKKDNFCHSPKTKTMDWFSKFSPIKDNFCQSPKIKRNPVPNKCQIISNHKTCKISSTPKEVQIVYRLFLMNCYLTAVEVEWLILFGLNCLDSTYTLLLSDSEWQKTWA